jgi:hypothetical protein
MLEALLLRWAFLERTLDVETLLRAAGGEAPPPLADRAAEKSRAPVSSARAILDSIARTAPPENRSAAADAAPTAQRHATPAIVRDDAPDIASAAHIHHAPGGNPKQDGERALRAMLAQRRAPQGLGIFLNTARVADATDRSLVLEMAAGPGFERLSSEAATRHAMQEVLAEFLGHPIELNVRPARGGVRPENDTEPVQRITPEAVRQQKLETLTRDHPALRGAVAEWDLELFD